MGLLLAVAFAVGALTVMTPCVLPVLPIVLAGGTSGSRRRPLLIVAGLVTSFTLFTLFWTAILDALPLPGDLLRNIAIGVIALTAVSLVVPRVAELAERPLARLTRLRPPGESGSFVLGLALGLVFTPCAGLLIGSVATAAATQEYSLRLVAVLLTYSLGVAAALLGVMFLARRGLAMERVRRSAPRIRQGLGVLMAGAVVVMILGVDARLATKIPDGLDGALGIQEADRVAGELQRLSPATGIGAATADARVDPAPQAKAADLSEELALAERLRRYGEAPEFRGLGGWINGRPRTLEELRGKVVVIDFWTYSCVNCLRTLPYLRRWHETYAAEGLEIVGVHTPEFAFEAERRNVEKAVRDLDVTWPVALDSDYGTWTAWGNRYWPAKYFIGRDGQVRHAHFGEGAYEESESVIRALLAERAPEGTDLPARADLPAEPSPHRVRTPETYLGHQRADKVATPLTPDRVADYRLPQLLKEDELGYGGRWRVLDERAVAVRDARLGLRFRGRAVHLVLGTESGRPGTVQVLVDGRRVRTVRVSGHRLYTLAETTDDLHHRLELRFSAGVAGYAFTFGPLVG